MKLSNVLVVIAAITLSGIVPRLIHGNPEYEKYVTNNRQAIEKAIQETLSRSDPVCLNIEPFPATFDSNGPFFSCEHCDDLQQLGLVDKEIRELPSDDGNGMRHVITYTLTSSGESAYRETDSFSRGAGICLGKTTLHEILDISQPQKINEMFGPNPVWTGIIVEYTAKVLDPHPALFDPKVKSLGITAPEQGDPVQYPSQEIAISFDENGKLLLVGDDRQFDWLKSKLHR